MTKQVQRRRGTGTQHTSFTGAEGEITVNTTNLSAHVHDGVTTGGIEVARADMNNVASADLLAGIGLTSTVAELNYTDGVTSAIQTQLDDKAPIASPTFTGTISAGDIATTGNVDGRDLSVDGAKLDPKFRILSLNRRRARHYAGGGVMLRLRRPLAFNNPYSPL